MANSADRKVIAYVADIKDVKAKLRELQRLNSHLSKGLGTDVAQGYKKVGQSLGQIKTTKISKGLDSLANTSTRTSQTLKKLDGSLVQVTNTSKVNSKGVARVTTSYKDLDKNSVSLSQNISRLAKRAAMTIPLWLALRGAVMGTIRVFKDGIATMAEQDKAFQKAKRNLQGTTTEIEANFKKLQNASLELSLQTGESVADITTAFQRFATTGLDFETSLAGANASVKTAVLLFGETEQIANAVARAYRVLGGRTDKYASKGEELTSTLALMADLWKDNAFEVSEFNGAIERVAPTALSTNLALSDTVKLLGAIQTAGIRGTRAGRLLSTAITQMEKNFDSFSSVLGVNLRSVDNTYDRLLLVAKGINDVKKTDPVAAGQAITKLFGRRAGDVPKALAAMNKELVEMENRTGSIEEFNKDFEEQNKQLHRLVVQYHNLNKEIGKAFVTGIVGGKDFTDTVDKLTQAQIKMVPIFKSFGDGLIASFKVLTLQTNLAIKDFKKLNTVKLTQAQKAVEDLFNLSGIKDAGIIEDLLKNLESAIPTGIFGYKEELQTQIKKLLEEKLVQLNEVAAAQKKINDLQTDEIENQKKSIPPADKHKIAQAILNVKLAEMKANGAIESQLLKTESILIKRLGIEEKTLDKVIRQLELERALSEERRLQSELGNESLKIFRIAQENGVEVAKKIGDVLAGKIDFGNFIRSGGEAVDIFKNKFADVFEQQQAKSFFKGLSVPGLQGLRGGSGIAIQEPAIRDKFTPTGAILSQRKAERQFTRLETTIPVTVPTTITANIDISKMDEVSKKVVDDISAQLPKAGSKINIALKNALLGKQSQ